jgi:hypothetical protein
MNRRGMRGYAASACAPESGPCAFDLISVNQETT